MSEDNIEPGFIPGAGNCRACKDKFSSIAKRYKRPLAIENMLLRNYVVAEAYHQDYLQKHPQGYCHIHLSLADEPIQVGPLSDTPPDAETLETFCLNKYIR